MSAREKKLAAGGIVHTYLGYDPRRFPMPTQAPPDLVTPAFEYMLTYGSLRHLTEEELANAIEIDPSQIAGLGPSLESILAMLLERKRKILETYRTDGVRRQADELFRRTAAEARPPQNWQKEFERIIREEQIADLERLWYRVDKPRGGAAAQRRDAPQQERAFAARLLGVMERLGDKYQVEEMAAKYAFTGRRDMTVPQALEIKEELETIDRLIEQLKEAARSAKIYLVNFEELARFVSEEQIAGLEQLQRQVEEFLRHLAEEQGLQNEKGRFSLTPRAFRIFQSKLLDRIFTDLVAARSGRHVVEVSGDGAVELQRTKRYEFGDSLANMDVTASLINAMVRAAGSEAGWETAGCTSEKDGAAGSTSAIRDARRGIGPVRLKPEDIEIHLTRNNPKCATVVCMDMSGSMRWDGLYVHVKRMALALHGLIRTEYPGDFLDFVEIYTLPRRRHISEVPQLLPKPVTIHEPWVRLKADLSDERLSERDIPPHFTNIQRGLALARQLLCVQDTLNRQIILITDGLPTAHFEEHWLYLLYPPDRRTEHFTLREGLICREQNITINIFLLSSWAQSEEDVRFAYRLAEQTRGRVFFVGGRELDRFVVWDYLRRRRFTIG